MQALDIALRKAIQIEHIAAHHQSKHVLKHSVAWLYFARIGEEAHSSINLLLKIVAKDFAIPYSVASEGDRAQGCIIKSP